ncbi:hypothetical protein MFUM_50024 [Methylacidiphilum fumariolicum SolV]|uniref:Uncharacterized protein n=2 Tax=Candidatus Methylacidiphilum fumarolicum TaxID=591154 RepID=I0JYB3_METFB|nr:conserved protein of unknown function [Candidatus Methylacidiphilum fumarolicum]CCG92232.1 hypothetical protein MFUM_50024 [Methylacidiphilum fumariolicum SolV]
MSHIDPESALHPCLPRQCSLHLDTFKRCFDLSFEVVSSPDYLFVWLTKENNQVISSAF